jgi:hypothetical protein
VVTAGLLLAGWGVSVGVAGADPEPSPAPASPAPASPSNTPAGAPGPAPKTTIDKDGTYAVGSDIVPGTYVSAGPVGSGTCYWKRLGNPDGALLDNALSKKPQVVQIQATDKAFKTDGCQPWQQNNDATPPPEAAGPQLQAGLGILNGLLAPNGQPAPSAPPPSAQPSPSAQPGPSAQPSPSASPAPHS